MKKHNRNILAYVRHPQAHSNDEATLLRGQDSHKGCQTIYNAIIDQLEPDHSEYIQRLMEKTNKKEEKVRKLRGTGIHERVKSYGGILIKSPQQVHEDQNELLAFEESNKSIKVVDTLSEKQDTTRSNENPVLLETVPPPIKTEVKIDNSFLSSLDNYLCTLQTPKRRDSVGKNSFERRTVLKHRDLSPKRSKGVHIEKKEKIDPQLCHTLEHLFKQNIKLKKKVKVIKKTAIQKLQEVNEQNQLLEKQLERKNCRVKQLQKFFHDICSKFHSLDRHRRINGSTGYVSKISPFEIGGTSEQSDLQSLQEECSWALKKSSSEKTKLRSKFKQVQSLQQSRLNGNYLDGGKNGKRLAKLLQNREKDFYESEDSEELLF